MIEEVKHLCELGFAVHLLRPYSKIPLASQWTKGPLLDWSDLKSKYQKPMNVGVRLGQVSKIGNRFLAVVDCDVKSSEEKHQIEMAKKLRELIPDLGTRTPHVRSGRGNGSGHYYVATESPANPQRLAQSSEKVKVKMPSVKPSKHELETILPKELSEGWRLRPAWEISLMGEGQQVVLPPSIHPDTKRLYRWERQIQKVCDIPSIEFKQLPKKEKHKSDLKSEVEVGLAPVSVDLERTSLPANVIEKIKNGDSEATDRSATLFGVACSMLRFGLTDEQILSVLSDKKYFLGQVAYDHTQSSNRPRAIEWLRKYTLESAKKSRFGEFKSPEIISPFENERFGLEFGDWKQIDRSGKQGEGPPKATVKNIVCILVSTFGKSVFIHDEFAHADLYGMKLPWGGERKKEIRDIDIISIKTWLSQKWYFEPSDDKISQAVSFIASQNKFHPIKEYLESLEWDGVKRLDNWLENYLGAIGPKPYLSAVGVKMLVAMVARIYNPGCKFDYVPILEGPQGCGKSTTVKILSAPWFTDTYLNIGDKDTELAMRSIWVMEMGELAGMRKADVNLLKQFITRTEDRIRVPYGKRTENFPRQCIFVGTTNSKSYLKDSSGNRRFLPIEIRQCDFKKLNKDRNQLLAEAIVVWRLGEPLYLENPEVLQLALLEQEDRVPEDLMREALVAFLDKGNENFDKDRFTIESLFADFGPLSKYRGDRYETMQVAEILKSLGYQKKRAERDGDRKTWWEKKGQSST